MIVNKERYIRLLSCSHRTLLCAFCEGIYKGQNVLSSSLKKRQCCVEACCEMTGSSLSLTEAGKNVKTYPQSA